MHFKLASTISAYLLLITVSVSGLVIPSTTLTRALDIRSESSLDKSDSNVGDLEARADIITPLDATLGQVLDLVDGILANVTGALGIKGRSDLTIPVSN